MPSVNSASSGGLTATPKKVSEAEEQFMYCNRMREVLTESIGLLANKLSPVSRHSVQGEESNCAEVIELANVPYKVPLVGNVTVVIPVTVTVVAKLPDIVHVEATLLATPVPP